MAVTQKLNHLLKSPFVVHPGTGRICVPIDTGRLEEFDPLDVPTLQGLVRDVDAYIEGQVNVDVEGQGDGGGDKEVGKHVQDWEKTRLRPYIEYFRGFVNGLMRDEREAVVKREEGEEEVGMESLEF